MQLTQTISNHQTKSNIRKRKIKYISQTKWGGMKASRPFSYVATISAPPESADQHKQHQGHLFISADFKKNGEWHWTNRMQKEKKRQDVPCLMEAKAKPLSWLSYHFLGNAVSLSSLVTFNDSTLLFRLPVASHFRLASSFRCVSSFHSAFCVTVFQSRRFRRDGGGVDGNSSFQRITPILYWDSLQQLWFEILSLPSFHIYTFQQ